MASPLRSVLALTLGVLFLSGCWPARWTKQPGIQARVLNAVTDEPAAGAIAELSRLHDDGHALAGQEALVQVTVPADGVIHLKPVRRWFLYIVPMDPGSMEYLFKVESQDGAKSAERHFGHRTFGQDPVMDLGTLVLQEKSHHDSK